MVLARHRIWPHESGTTMPMMSRHLHLFKDQQFRWCLTTSAKSLEVLQGIWTIFAHKNSASKQRFEKNQNVIWKLNCSGLWCTGGWSVEWNYHPFFSELHHLRISPIIDSFSLIIYQQSLSLKIRHRCLCHFIFFWRN